MLQEFYSFSEYLLLQNVNATWSLLYYTPFTSSRPTLSGLVTKKKLEIFFHSERHEKGSLPSRLFLMLQLMDFFSHFHSILNTQANVEKLPTAFRKLLLLVGLNPCNEKKVVVSDAFFLCKGISCNCYFILLAFVKMFRSLSAHKAKVAVSLRVVFIIFQFLF